MPEPKYRITEKQISERHGIARLERDGFSRSQIMSSMYKLTPGVSQAERTKIVKQLFDRKGEC
jgi:hypothetical protein